MFKNSSHAIPKNDCHDMVIPRTGKTAFRASSVKRLAPAIIIITTMIAKIAFTVFFIFSQFP
jgi:hypothetical protein